MKNALNFRFLFCLGGSVCLMLLGSAYFLEYYFKLEPCPLCLLQRYVLWGMAILFGIGILQNPKQWGRIVYCGLIAVLSTIGLALATRHVWLQHLPPSTEIPTCTAGFEKMLAFKPFLEVLKNMLTESHGCALVDFTILGFSLSFWSLLCFIGFIAFNFILMVLQIKSNCSDR